MSFLTSVESVYEPVHRFTAKEPTLNRKFSLPKINTPNRNAEESTGPHGRDAMEKLETWLHDETNRRKRRPDGPERTVCIYDEVFRQIAYDHEVVRRSSYTPLATVRERPRLGMSSLNSRHFQSLCEGPAAFNTAFNTPRPPRFISPPASPPSRHCRTHREPLCSEQLHVLMRDSSEEEEEEEEGEGEGYPSQGLEVQERDRRSVARVHEELAQRRLEVHPAACKTPGCPYLASLVPSFRRTPRAEQGFCCPGCRLGALPEGHSTACPRQAKQNRKRFLHLVRGLELGPHGTAHDSHFAEVRTELETFQARHAAAEIERGMHEACASPRHQVSQRAQMERRRLESTAARQHRLEQVSIEMQLSTGAATSDREDLATRIGRHRFLRECTRQNVLPLACMSLDHEGSDPSVLNLSGYVLGDSSWKAFAMSLTVNKGPLRALRLARNSMSGEACRAVLQALWAPPPMLPAPPPSAPGAPLLASLPAWSPAVASLTELDLAGNMIGMQGAEAIADLVPRCKGLLSLNVSRNQLSDIAVAMVVEAIAASAYGLSELNLSHNRVDRVPLHEDVVCFHSQPQHRPNRPCAAVSLAHMIRNHSSLESLDLSYSAIRLQSAEVLALALEANDSLTDVALSWNGFGHRMPSELRQDSDDEEEEEAEAVQTGSASRYPTIAALKSALQHNSSLLSLDLAHNGLGPAEALILAPAFRASTSLRRVILDHNPIGHTGGSALLHVLQAGTKCCISLHKCDFAMGSFEQPQPMFGPRPSALYSLNLSSAFDHSIAQLLFMRAERIGVLSGKQAEGGLTEHPVLEGPAILNAKLDKGWLQYDEDMLAPSKHRIFPLPHEGLLRFEYYEPEFLAPSHGPALWPEPSRRLLQVLADQPLPHRLPVLQIVCTRWALSASQVQALFPLFTEPEGPCGDFLEAMVLMWSAVRDPRGLEARARAHLSEAMHSQLYRRLGNLAAFNPTQTSGHYALQMGDERERILCQRLGEVSAAQAQQRQGAGPDYSQAKNGSAFRNGLLWSVDAEGNDMSEPYLVDSRRPLPLEGTLEFDFILWEESSGREPVEDAMYSALLNTVKHLKEDYPAQCRWVDRHLEGYVSAKQAVALLAEMDVSEEEELEGCLDSPYVRVLSIMWDRIIKDEKDFHTLESLLRGESPPSAEC